MAAAHHVRRLRWRSRVPDAAQALALRTLLRSRSDELATTMQSVFDEAVPADEVWHLPRLQLQLRSADLDSLTAELPAALAAALRRALAEAPLGAMAAAQGRAADVVPNETPPAGPRREPLGHAARAALWHYLVDAQPVPAWAALEAAPLEQALGEAAVALAESGPAAIEALATALPALRPRIGAWVRWLALLPAEHRAALRRRHAAAAPLAMLDATAAADVHDAERLALWLAWPAATASAPTPDDLAAASAWLAGPRAIAPDWLAAARAAFDARIAAPGPTVAPPSARPTPPGERPPRPDAVLAEPSGAADSMPVPLAGLVLLHPYLPRLLAGCGLLSADGHELPEPRLARACGILHRLACGDVPAAEHQLPLIKLLLGRDPRQPLDAAIPMPGDAEREEVDALLGAVREHWGALRGTGVDSLRLSFLQRRGLLTRRQGHWQLRLQGEPFDLLLGLLPWAIGWVRLPWMDEPLEVEWPTP